MAKHILLAATTDLSYDQRMQRAAQSLAQAGYRVSLIGRLKKKSIPLSNQLPYHAHRLPCWFEKGKLFYLEFNLRLVGYLLFKKIDLLICADLDTMVAGAIIKLIKKMPLVFDAHEYFTEVPELQNRRLIKKMWQLVEKFTLPLTDARFTVNEQLAEVFEKKSGLRFHVIRNMPERKSFATIRLINGSAEMPYFIYSGAVNLGRGVELLLDVFSRMPYKLVVAGDGDLLQEMKRLHAQQYPQAKVEFKGYVPPAQLRDLIANATAGFNLLNPKSLNYKYSLANKFFDYVMAGIPQVCSHLPVYEQLNNEYKVALLVPYHVPSVVQATELLVTDSNLYQSMKANCQKAAGNWCWENEQKTLIQTVNQLLSNQNLNLKKPNELETIG